MLEQLMFDEKDLELRINILNLQHEKTLIKFIETNDEELAKQLKMLDSKIDHLHRLHENKVNQLNKLIYK